MGRIMICLGDSQNGHLPPVCSQRIANMRYIEPRMARWMMTGRLKPPRSSPTLSYSGIDNKVTCFLSGKGCCGIQGFFGCLWLFLDLDFNLFRFDLDFSFNLGFRFNLFSLNFLFSLSLLNLLFNLALLSDFSLLGLFLMLLLPLFRLFWLLGLFGFLGLLLLALLGLFWCLALMPIL